MFKRELDNEDIVGIKEMIKEEVYNKKIKYLKNLIQKNKAIKQYKLYRNHAWRIHGLIKKRNWIDENINMLDYS